MKPPSALLVNNKPLYYPEFTENLHYEAEIVLKVCKNGKHVQPEFAKRYYEEIAFGIDFTARDLQSQLKEKGHPWEIAKGFDGSAAVSDFMPLANVKDESVKFQMKKNNEVVQNGDTSDLIFDFDFIITYVSKFFKLQMGDYIFTGTPAGVGPVKVGDVLEGFIENEQMIRCEIR